MTPQAYSTHRKPDRRLPPPLIVDAPGEVSMLQRALKDVKRLAIDTESNSLHAYEAEVCLIQLSTDYEDFLVDPLQLDPATDLAFLGAMCADSTIEKVLHAAEYDVMTLNRDFGWEFANIFDTMIAARVLGWERVGLGNILEDRYGVRVNKRHQRANWGQRPLPMDLLRYAQKDTHYLLHLRDELHRLLAAGDHVEEARELFDEVCEARWSGTGFDPEGYWGISKARRLNPRELAVLREVYLLREHIAEEQDVPVFKVMGDHSLISLAREQPRTVDQIAHVKGLSHVHARRYGDDLLDAIAQGLKATPPDPPSRDNDHHYDEATSRRYDALHTWRKERAAQRGVSSEIVVSKDALWELAQEAPHSWDALREIETLGPWRTKTYGQEILDVIAEAS